jgi:hypothetical protein
LLLEHAVDPPLTQGAQQKVGGEVGIAEQQIAVLKPIGHRTQQLCSSPPLPR